MHFLKISILIHVLYTHWAKLIPQIEICEFLNIATGVQIYSLSKLLQHNTCIKLLLKVSRRGSFN